jgi:hypothetical protein
MVPLLHFATNYGSTPPRSKPISGKKRPLTGLLRHQGDKLWFRRATDFASGHIFYWWNCRCGQVGARRAGLDVLPGGSAPCPAATRRSTSRGLCRGTIKWPFGQLMVLFAARTPYGSPRDCTRVALHQELPGLVEVLAQGGKAQVGERKGLIARPSISAPAHPSEVVARRCTHSSFFALSVSFKTRGVISSLMTSRGRVHQFL